MVVTRKYSTKGFSQERLAKDDIAIIIKAIQNIDLTLLNCSDTRLELLITKLQRMEKQK